MTWKEVFESRDPKTMREKAEQAVNSFGYKAKEIAAEILEAGGKDLVGLIVLVYVKYWAESPEYLTDGRNEFAVRELRHVHAGNEFIGRYAKVLENADADDIKLAENFALQSTRMHKTLMQSFTAVVMELLGELFPDIPAERRGFPLI